MLVFDVELKKPPGKRLGVELVLAQPASGREKCLVVESITDGGVVDVWNRSRYPPQRIKKGDAITRVNGAADISSLASELRSAETLRVTIQRDEQVATDVAHPRAALARPPGPPPHPRELHYAAMVHDRGQRQQAAQWMQQQQQLRQAPLQGAPQQGHLPMLPPGMQQPAAPPPPPPPGGLGGPKQIDFIFEAIVTKAEDSRLGIDVLPVTISEFQGLNVLNVAEGGAVDLWNQQQAKDRMRIRKGDALMSVNNVKSDIAKMMEELRTQRRLQLFVLRRSSGGPAPAPGIGPPPGAKNPALMPHTGPQWGGHYTPPGLEDDYVQRRGLGGPAGEGASGPDPGPHDVPATTLGGGSAPAGLDGAQRPEGRLRVGPDSTEAAAAAVAARGAPAGDAGAPPALGAPAGAAQNSPFVFEAILPKNENSRLGIDVLPVAIGEYGGLSVLKVSANGIVARWNAEQTSALRICPGDALMSINDVRGTDIKRMMDALSVPQELRLLVLRRPNGTLVPRQVTTAPPAPPPPPPPPSGGGAAGAPAQAAVPPTQPSAQPPAQPPPQPPQHMPSFAMGAGDRLSARSRSEVAAEAPAMPPPPPPSFIAPAPPAAAAATEAPAMPPPPPPSFTAPARAAAAAAASAPADADTAASAPADADTAAEGAPSATSPEESRSPTRFEVVVDRAPGVPLGLDVVLVQGGSPAMGLLAERIVEGGPIDAWNKRSKMPHRVLPGDRILQVNQVQAWEPPTERAKEFKKDRGQIRFCVQRGVGLAPPPPEEPAADEEGGAAGAVAGDAEIEQTQAQEGEKDGDDEVPADGAEEAAVVSAVVPPGIMPPPTAPPPPPPGACEGPPPMKPPAPPMDVPSEPPPPPPEQQQREQPEQEAEKEREVEEKNDEEKEKMEEEEEEQEEEEEKEEEEEEEKKEDDERRQEHLAEKQEEPEKEEQQEDAGDSAVEGADAAREEVAEADLDPSADDPSHSPPAEAPPPPPPTMP